MRGEGKGISQKKGKVQYIGRKDRYKGMIAN